MSNEPGVRHIDFKALVEAADPDRHKPIVVYEFGTGRNQRRFFEPEKKPGETYPWAE